MVITMQAVIPYALLIALTATLAVLVVGIGWHDARGEFNKRYGNKLMRWRVALQGISLVLFVLLMTWKGKGSSNPFTYVLTACCSGGCGLNHHWPLPFKEFSMEINILGVIGARDKWVTASPMLPPWRGYRWS
jgi:hypothetical protein